MIVCSECGGKNIQTAAWVDANTNEYDDEYDGNTYCEDCQEHTTLEDESNYKENLKEA